MTFQEIEQKIKNALLRFYKEDSYLIDNNVHERSLTFRLGMYLQNEFPDYNVDCEYNKNCQTFQHNKLLSARCDEEPKFNCKECGDHRKCTVFPDIIIHQRGTDKNLLVIEAKCNASVSQIAEDKEKLQAYLDEPTLCYQYGLFINFQETLEKTLKDLYWVPDNYDCEGRKNIGNEVE
jgi:hypothetical protein